MIFCGTIITDETAYWNVYIGMEDFIENMT